MIRHLAARHDVTVVSLVRSDAEANEGKGIAPHCSHFEMARVHDAIQGLRMLVRLPTPEPSSFGFFYSSSLASRIRAIAAEHRFDLVFVHCSSVAPYVVGLRDVPKILDFGDMDSQKWLEYAHYKPFPLAAGYWLEGVKLERKEKQLAKQFDLCTATTRAEWETLKSLDTGVDSDWFPNGVDSAFFVPGSDSYDPDLVSFIGRMDYYPNQECMVAFCKNTLPILKSQRPTTKLVIVGADPSPEIRRLGDIPGVTVTGSVADVRPFVRQSAAMVAPLNIARGTQNKILEAMAMGVPVVTSRVAAGGVDAQDREHFLVSDSPHDYAQALLRLMGDPAERQRLALAGRERMLSHHAWDRSMQRLDRIIERCLAARGSGVANPRERAMQS
jgi:hypothetical protein